MAHGSKQPRCSVLTNSQTEMFSVYAGNVRSSWLVVGAVASCSTHAGLRHWNLKKPAMCCATSYDQCLEKRQDLKIIPWRRCQNIPMLDHDLASSVQRDIMITLGKDFSVKYKQQAVAAILKRLFSCYSVTRMRFHEDSTSTKRQTQSPRYKRTKRHNGKKIKKKLTPTRGGIPRWQWKRPSPSLPLLYILHSPSPLSHSLPTLPGGVECVGAFAWRTGG